MDSREIIARFDAGDPARTIALDVGLSERYVRMVLKKTPGSAVEGLAKSPPLNDSQLDLF